MLLVQLSHRALLFVTGGDCEPFLDGLITSTLPGVGEAVGNALLTPQGKLLFSFLISRHEDGFVLDCDARDVQALTQRLTLYKLRAKVTLNPSDRPVFASLGTDIDGGVADLRHPAMGKRVYKDVKATRPLESYLTHRARLGVLEGPDEILPNTDFPHDVALDLTGAVSFTKGCFVGQEVVSRVKHRGTARKRPVLLQGDTLTVGASIMAAERAIGSVRLVAQNAKTGVAVIRLDHVTDDIRVEDNPVTLSLPPYATYSLGKDVADQSEAS
ncbi:MAG: folate-binding protein [Pseudomonadota bacterium]